MYVDEAPIPQNAENIKQILSFLWNIIIWHLDSFKKYQMRNVSIAELNIFKIYQLKRKLVQ